MHQMKPVSMSWAMSVVVAICLTPGFRSSLRSDATQHPTATQRLTAQHLMRIAQADSPDDSQSDGAVAVPGSADSPVPLDGSDEDTDQSGLLTKNGQTPDDDASQQMPSDVRQPPDDDESNDEDSSTRRQRADQPSDEDQGATSARSSSSEDSDDTATQSQSDENDDQGSAPRQPSGDNDND
jgi:hypothetical protein